MLRDAFERVHHFHGQRLELDDYERAVRVPIERRRLHLRWMHPPGVIGGVLDEMRVEPLEPPGLDVVVGPGMAVDGEGREIPLLERAIATVDPERLRIPGTVHVVIRLVEEPTDFVEDAEHAEFQGHRRVRERGRLEVIDRRPDPAREVELARVRLSSEPREIRSPRDPGSPGDDEIDRRFVPRAGAAGGLPPEESWALGVVLDSLGELATTGLGRLGMTVFRELRVAAHLARLSLVPPCNGAALSRGLCYLALVLDETIAGLGRRYPSMRADGPLRSLLDRRGLLPAPRGALHPGGDDLARVTRDLRELGDDLAALLVRVEGMDDGGRVRLSLPELEACSPGPPDHLELEGRAWRVVDRLDPIDGASAAAHRVSLRGPRDTWSARGDFLYPDRQRIVDRGRGLAGGSIRFVARGLRSGADLLIVRRLDALRSEGVVDVVVGGRRLPRPWIVTGRDPAHRWRNSVYRVPGAHVAGADVLLELAPRETERGLVLFRLWLLQPEDHETETWTHRSEPGGPADARRRR